MTKIHRGKFLRGIGSRQCVLSCNKLAGISLSLQGTLKLRLIDVVRMLYAEKGVEAANVATDRSPEVVYSISHVYCGWNRSPLTGSSVRWRSRELRFHSRLQEHQGFWRCCSPVAMATAHDAVRTAESGRRSLNPEHA